MAELGVSRGRKERVERWVGLKLLDDEGAGVCGENGCAWHVQMRLCAHSQRQSAALFFVHII